MSNCLPSWRSDPTRRTGPIPIPRASSTLPNFQFSLSRLLIVVTAAAILLGLAVTVSGFVPTVVAALVWCVLPTPFVICALFARGDIRAFAIGALIPWLLLLRDATPGPALLFSIWLLIMPVVCGVIALMTYRWVQRRP